MKKFNKYYIETGYISCMGTRFPEDESYSFLISQLTEDELKEKFLCFFWSNRRDLISLSEYAFFEAFLKEASEEEGLYFEQEGNGYSPSMEGILCGESIDILKKFAIKSILTEKDFIEHLDYIKTEKLNEDRMKKEKEINKEKRNKIRKEYQDKVKERDDFIKLSKKFNPSFDENSVPSPEFPKELEPNSFQKYLIENGRMKKEDLLKME